MIDVRFRYNGKNTGLISGLVQGLGVAVLALDMPGHGSRQTEGAANFYRRYPAGSMLGAMVGNIAAALDVIHCASPGASALVECHDGSVPSGPYAPLKLPLLDETRVTLVGFVTLSLVRVTRPTLTATVWPQILPRSDGRTSRCSSATAPNRRCRGIWRLVTPA